MAQDIARVSSKGSESGLVDKAFSQGHFHTPDCVTWYSWQEENKYKLESFQFHYIILFQVYYVLCVSQCCGIGVFLLTGVTVHQVILERVEDCSHAL